MSEIHGRLLIGGMTLKNLSGSIEVHGDYPASDWCGHLLIEPAQNEHLEAGRLYRLELDDGRAGQIAISHVDYPAGERKVRVCFDGKTALGCLDVAGHEHRVTAQPQEV